LSFTMFVSFVLFMIVYLNPVKGGLLQSSVLEELEDSFLEAVEVDLIKFPINYTSDCIKINVSEFGAANSYVVDSGGVEVTSGVSGGSLFISASPGIYTVYLSEALEAGAASCSDEAYERGHTEKSNIISYTALEEFEQNYTSSYQVLKETLRFPLTRDFEVKCSGCGNYELSQSIPEDVDIFAKTFSSQILYSNGTIKNVEFTLRVW